MRIERAHVLAVRLPLAGPLATAHGLVRTRDCALLALEAGGLAGWGEAAPLPGFGLERFEEALGALEAVAHAAPGAAADDPDAAFERLEPLLGGAPAARAAVDAALLDLAARLRGVPVAALLAGGGEIRPVAVSALIAEPDPGAAAARARARVAAGFGTLKLKIGAAPLADDLVRIAAVRDAVGDGVRLRLDANGAFAEDEAREALAALARFAPEWVEQPIAPGDPGVLARLRAGAPVPIAADEAVRDEASARALLDAGAVDALVLKPAAAGGLRACARIAAAARAAGLAVAVTTFLDGAIGRAAARALAAALVPPVAAAGLATGGLLADDVAALPDPERGTLAPPAAAGLGVAPDPAALRRLAVPGADARRSASAAG